jgi:hypothetical protein
MRLSHKDLEGLELSLRVEDLTLKKIAHDLVFNKTYDRDDLMMLEIVDFLRDYYEAKGLKDQPRDRLGRWTRGGDSVDGGSGNDIPPPPMGHNRPPVAVKPSKVPMGPMLPAMLDHIFNRNRLPQERQDAVNNTLSHINNGTVPEGLGDKWGAKYHNEGDILPQYGDRGVTESLTYKEYKVAPPPNEYNIGTWRIVQGSDGSTYLTGSHYGRRQDGQQQRPFVRIK